ncbi:Hypothetical_protein [Hexamita inflata]|uniref:Hypothetical_protein n=1 Tax=Hexamita inflata TaxID=28002 RepID=A0ABP1JHQ7_9EUKA
MLFYQYSSQGVHLVFNLSKVSKSGDGQIQCYFVSDMKLTGMWQNMCTQFQQVIYRDGFYTKSILLLKFSAILYLIQYHPKDSYKDNFRGQQCQFKCRTNLGCLRRLFRVTILEDEV